MKTHWPVLLVFILAIFIRVMYLPQKSLTFAYDQARDAFTILSIATGDIKFQGPPATAPGLFHGVLYWYLMLPAYLIGHGNPIYASVWLSIINASTVFIVYGLSQMMFKNRRISLILAVLFAVSFGESQYSTWLSNGSIASFFVPIIYLGLWGWINRKSWGAFITGLGLASSVQSEVFLLYHLPVIILLWVLGRINFNRKSLVHFLVPFLVGISTMIASDIRFGFPSIRGLHNLFIKQDAAVVGRTLTDHISIYLNQFGHLFSINLFPINIGYAGLAGIALILFVVNRLKNTSQTPTELVLLYVLSSMFASPFGGTSTPYISVGLSVGVFLLLGVFFNFLLKNNKYWLAVVLSSIIAASNLYYIFSNNSHGQTNFAIQDITLDKELAALDYIYKSQSGIPFSINTITSPLYINVLWSYLFNWYGLNKYGYLPFWHGHEQVNLLGNNLKRPDKNVADYYLIIEPNEINLDHWIEPLIQEENGYSRLLSERNFGQIRVQRRHKI